MKFKSLIKPLIPNVFLEHYRNRQNDAEIDNFRFNGDSSYDIKSDIQNKYRHGSELLDIFSSNEEFSVHKWHHYIPLYERYFSSFRKRKIRFLEIGVDKGGSLQMWRKYFGDEAIIFGIDINPECKKHNGVSGQVRIGSQTDKAFLKSVVEEMGGVDIVLDDGSHQMKHIPATLKILFPHLSYSGIYMIEDLHTAYWKSYGGGYRAKNNFFKFLMGLADDIHHWYHSKGLKHAAISKDCSGIHIHDSIVVLDKNKAHQPVHSKIP